jgi:HEAT repeat protein
MWAFLSAPDSDVTVRIAAWTTVWVSAMTLVLFAYSLGLRAATVQAAKRRRAIIERWRGIFAAAILSGSYARECTLPRYTRAERSDLLEEWNLARDSVEGEAVGHLIVIGERLGVDAVARRMLRARRLSARLAAIQTLGHLRSRAEWAALIALLDDPNAALSVTAARALVEIDAHDSVPLVMPKVVTRVDWPATTVSKILEKAGPDLVTQPLCSAILISEAATSVRLLKFAELARTERIDQLVEILLRERQEPRVLAAAMKALSSSAGLPHVERLAAHEVWYVRMQAAKLLGRFGHERDLALLEGLLRDAEWWVRYRAAQAIVALPFLGPNRLRQIRDRQTDRYAGDMMQQAIAEAGLA